MKKIKNKFIISIIFIIILISGIEIYNTYLLNKVDRNSYVYLIEGKGQLNNKDLLKGKKEKLNPGDQIKTIGKESLAMIKWGEGSITRIGGDSKVIVKQSDISKNLLDIKILFSLERGKTWSDVVSFVGGKSYFYEEFADTTAAVRGTVFEVNLQRKYIYVKHNSVKLSKGDKQKIIGEDEAFDIKSFSFIDLLNFVQNIKDKAWQKLNIKLDKEFYNNFLKQVKNLNNFSVKQLDNLANLTPEKKKELYRQIKARYQQLNFLKPDSELFNQKLELKQYLIELSSSSKEKQDLLQTSFYDLKDIVNTKKLDDLYKIIEIFGENTKLLETTNIDIDYKQYFNSRIFEKIKLPKGLQKEFERNFNNIKSVLKLPNVDLNNIEYQFIEYKNLLKTNIENSSFMQKFKEFVLRLLNK